MENSTLVYVIFNWRLVWANTFYTSTGQFYFFRGELPVYALFIPK